MSLFDTHIILDWSAATKPTPKRPSADAIWWAAAGEDPVYARTRAEAVAGLTARLDEERAAGRRVLVGFDFPFGYPAGVAQTVCGTASALSLWDWISERTKNDETNASNHYAIAEEINRLYPGTGPFWGRPARWDHPDIPTGANQRAGDHPPERRAVEEAVPRTKTVWQLAYTGSVGSQVLTGLPILNTLRQRPDTVVWPFDTGLDVPDAGVVLAEIYPSLLDPLVKARMTDDAIKDAVQVSVTAAAYAALDAKGGLAAAFRGPDLDAETRATIAAEEAWILGAGGQEAAILAALDPVPPATHLRYETDPAAIYAKSFGIVASEARLERFPEPLRPLITRIIHSCGMIEVADRIAFSPEAMEAGQAALAAGAPVFTDCEMVRSGISRQFMGETEIICTLNNRETPGLAKTLSTTRSAAAVEAWRDRIDGAVVAIGNAPTTLFHLLARIDEGWPKPALILGFPVGFVGAAESKAELAERPRGIPFVTLRGRRGGSAMASAAVNAVAAGLGQAT